MADSPRPEERLSVTTLDGQKLVLRRLQPKFRNEHPPVMLVHGLGSNHHTFRFAERSMADWLVDRGHDVWMPELRGHGDSRRREYNWLFDHYLQHDIPAIIGAIRDYTGAETLQWVGHSMGGVLLYCYGILQPSAPIQRGVTIASALDYSVGASGFKPLLKLRPVLEKMGVVPYGMLVHLLSPALGRAIHMEGFNLWPSNMEPHLVRRLHARVFNNIPMSLLSSLATTFDEGGLRLHDGFQFLPHAPDIQIPIQLIAGSRDKQVSIPAIENTAQLIGSNASVKVHGSAYGDRDEYGHFDLIVGRNAESEVWPGIAEWLEG